MKLKKFFLILFLSLFLAGAGGVYFFAFTTPGARCLVRYCLTHFVPAQQKSLGDVSGTVLSKIVIKDLELRALEKLPVGNIVKVQAVTIIPVYPHWKNSSVVVENGRLLLPNAEPIVFQGNYRVRTLDGNLFTPLLSVKDLMSIILKEKGKSFGGFIRHPDLYIKGHLDNLHVTSHFLGEKITNPKFTLLNSNGDLDLNVAQITSAQDRSYAGRLTFRGGELVARNIKFNLVESKIQVGSALYETIFDIKATTQVEDVKITLVIRGTRSNPQIEVASYPSYPQDTLLLMLATGRSLGASQGSSASGQKVASDLSSGIMDFFLLDNAIAQGLGITDAGIIFNEQSTGVGIKKRILPNVSVGYEIDRKNTAPQQPAEYQQRLGGELRLTNEISVSAQKELRREDPAATATTNTSPATKPNDEFMLKFKKNF